MKRHSLTERVRSVSARSEPDSGASLTPIRKKMMEDAPKGLTKRQEEVLSLLSSGKSNVWIARQLSISEATLKTHIRHIYGELNVSNRDDLLEAIKNHQSTEVAFWVPR
ncbi:DNA-binding response regulator [Lachnotalea sp. AF33-28]|nr:DNA-binding response regulator [Lachnotalea sp. AF33-28]